MRFLRKYIFSNALLKILALAISMLLWATYTSEPYVEVEYHVALEFVNVPAALKISGNVPDTVEVHVRGRSAFLRRLGSSDLILRIDLTGKSQGDSLIELTPEMVQTPFGSDVISVSPSQFHLTLKPPTSSSPSG